MAENLHRSTPGQLGKSGEHAGVARVNQAEHDGDDHRRDHHRHDQYRAEEPDAAEFTLAEERQRQPEHGLDGDGSPTKLTVTASEFRNWSSDHSRR